VVRWSWSSWNVLHSGMNEWKDEASLMPGIPVNNGTRIGVTCKDGFERTRHKMCRHQLNEWFYCHSSTGTGKRRRCRILYYVSDGLNGFRRAAANGEAVNKKPGIERLQALADTLRSALHSIYKFSIF